MRFLLLPALRLLTKKRIFMVFTLCGVMGNAMPALAFDDVNASESTECARMSREGIKQTFRGPKEEIDYTNRMLSCWAERLLLSSKTPQRTFMGKGMEMFENPAYIEAYTFSRSLCIRASSIPGFRGDYPCWFETADAGEGMSMEATARKEAPKLLFEKNIFNHNGTSSVKYTLCTNNDPTKKKEYTQSCQRGKDMVLTEYGRGDIDGNHVEDVAVLVKYGDIGDESKKCFVGLFTRKEGQLVHMTDFSPNGLCQ